MSSEALHGFRTRKDAASARREGRQDDRGRRGARLSCRRFTGPSPQLQQLQEGNERCAGDEQQAAGPRMRDSLRSVLLAVSPARRGGSARAEQRRYDCLTYSTTARGLPRAVGRPLAAAKGKSETDDHFGFGRFLVSLLSYSSGTKVSMISNIVSSPDGLQSAPLTVREQQLGAEPRRGLTEQRE
ncbi:hypothetical protein BCR35DRAFT_226675 [Leucosporidium creatinivorum]|uniref:Uncharacterized protein n=1 Tax=Leucosporidium creatinivorum TaxID=106004 RepID=A0A1Y2D4N6_9BASI|nr:hypothetical protein BCR35DRAFT_25039 [Leucosporidium creatinivorum]ORY54258.1 hypothetical protein BCR35DRAFT_226675 [Leucosporidium creatinivorum]